MAVWFLLHEAVVLIFFCGISYCEEDLLEGLKPKRDDPQELTDFLESVIKKKDEFKKIRMAAKAMLSIPKSILEEDAVFHTKQYNLPNFSKKRTNGIPNAQQNKHKINKNMMIRKRKLNKRYLQDKPINDVYPYMFDESDKENQLEERDEREERSSWNEFDNRPNYDYAKNKSPRIRYRRGLDLTDYSSANDDDRTNIHIYPRSRSGVRNVHGNKYEHRREAPLELRGQIEEKRRGVLGLESRDILGIQKENANENRPKKQHSLPRMHLDTCNDENLSGNPINAVTEKKVQASAKKLFFDKNQLRQKRLAMIKDRANRRKRSMKLNILDDNNLIKSVKHDSSSNSLILTLKMKNGKNQNLAPSDFLKTKIKQDISSNQLQEKQSKKLKDFNILDYVVSGKDSLVKPLILSNSSINNPSEMAVLYKIDEIENSDNRNYPSKIELLSAKKTNLEDVDEPTSAIEQHELSTKAYFLTPPAAVSSEDLFSTTLNLLKFKFADILTTPPPPQGHFVVKETSDMVHGRIAQKIGNLDKRTVLVSDKTKMQKYNFPLIKTLNIKKRFVQEPVDNYDYAEVIKDRLRNAWKLYNTNHDPDSEDVVSQIIKHSNKNNKLTLENTGRDNEYEYEAQEDNENQANNNNFKSRKLLSSAEDEINSKVKVYDDKKYGELDYENGRYSHMNESGYTQNKIRVKRLFDDFLDKRDDDYFDYDYPSLRGKRGDDYSYEEEGDSAVGETQTYRDKKEDKSRTPDLTFLNAKGDDGEFTLADAFKDLKARYQGDSNVYKSRIKSLTKVIHDKIKDKTSKNARIVKRESCNSDCKSDCKNCKNGKCTNCDNKCKGCKKVNLNTEYEETPQEDKPDILKRIENLSTRLELLNNEHDYWEKLKNNGYELEKPARGSLVDSELMDAQTCNPHFEELGNSIRDTTNDANDKIKLKSRNDRSAAKISNQQQESYERFTTNCYIREENNIQKRTSAKMTNIEDATSIAGEIQNSFKEIMNFEENNDIQNSTGDVLKNLTKRFIQANNPLFPKRKFKKHYTRIMSDTKNNFNSAKITDINQDEFGDSSDTIGFAHHPIKAKVRYNITGKTHPNSKTPQLESKFYSPQTQKIPSRMPAALSGEKTFPGKPHGSSEVFVEEEPIMPNKKFMTTDETLPQNKLHEMHEDNDETEDVFPNKSHLALEEDIESNNLHDATEEETYLDNLHTPQENMQANNLNFSRGELLPTKPHMTQEKEKSSDKFHETQKEEIYPDNLIESWKENPPTNKPHKTKEQIFPNKLHETWKENIPSYNSHEMRVEGKLYQTPTEIVRNQLYTSGSETADMHEKDTFLNNDDTHEEDQILEDVASNKLHHSNTLHKTHNISPNRLYNSEKDELIPENLQVLKDSHAMEKEDAPSNRLQKEEMAFNKLHSIRKEEMPLSLAKVDQEVRQPGYFKNLGTFSSDLSVRRHGKSKNEYDDYILDDSTGNITNSKPKKTLAPETIKDEVSADYSIEEARFRNSTSKFDNKKRNKIYTKKKPNKTKINHVHHRLKPHWKTFNNNNNDNKKKPNTYGNRNYKVHESDTRILNDDQLDIIDALGDIEELKNKRRVNKRETDEAMQFKKSIQELQRRGNYIGTEETINQAPFERYFKINDGFWKINPAKYRRHVHGRKLPYQIISHGKQIQPILHLGKLTNAYHNKILSKRQGPYLLEKRFRRDALPKQNKGNSKKRLHPKTIIGSAIPHEMAVNAYQAQHPDSHQHHKDKFRVDFIPERSRTKGKCKSHTLLGNEMGINANVAMKTPLEAASPPDDSEIIVGTKDYGQMHEAINGHLASLIVSNVFKKIKEHQQLHRRFSHGLYRKHGYRSEMKNLNAFRNIETEGDIKHTEEMLHQIMKVLNKIILDQVRRRTCKHLSPELQTYLANLTKGPNPIKPETDEESKISEEGFPLPLIKSGKKDKPTDTEQRGFLFHNPANVPELDQDEAEIKKKMKMIRNLLDKYKHMSTECRVKVGDVEAYLKKHLSLLRRMLKAVKKQQALEHKDATNMNMNQIPPKIKRKHYKNSFGDSMLQRDLLNKHIDDIRLGSSRSHTPKINLEKINRDILSNVRKKEYQNRLTQSGDMQMLRSRANSRNEDELDSEENDESPRKERKRDIEDNENEKPRVSEKYKKLIQAAESIRKKRENEDRLGKLFGKIEKKSIKNEDDDMKLFGKDGQDFSHARFETPVVFSLKK